MTLNDRVVSGIWLTDLALPVWAFAVHDEIIFFIAMVYGAISIPFSYFVMGADREIFTKEQLSIFGYGAAFVIYLPVLFYGSAHDRDWLTREGIYLLVPMFISIVLYYGSLSSFKLSRFDYMVQHVLILATFILGTPLVAWGPGWVFQTGNFARLAGIFQIMAFIAFVNVVLHGQSNRKHPS